MWSLVKSMYCFNHDNIMCQRATRIERYFLTSLHYFIVLKTAMNAAGPADCCVSTTVQLMMYTH